jgi:predicted PurR-regulated permease PerM
MDTKLTNRGLLRVVLVAFALFLAYRFLAAVVATVLLLAAGLLFTVALSAPVEALHRRKVPRSVSVALLVLGAAVLLGLGGYVLFPILMEQASQLTSALPGALSQLVERVREPARSVGIRIGGEGIAPSTLADLGRKLLGGALGLFSSLISFFFGLVVVVFIPLYLAAKPEPVVCWVVRIFPPGDREQVRELLSEARVSLLSWLWGRLVSMTIVGVLSTAVLYLIGIPGALFLGIFSGLVCFVPLIGPLVSAVPPLVLAFAGDPIDVLWVLLAYAVIQQIESNLLTPLVMEKTTSLHPAVVIASVTVAGAAFGILGTLLAVPAAVVVAVLVEELWFRRLEADITLPEKPG